MSLIAAVRTDSSSDVLARLQSVCDSQGLGDLSAHLSDLADLVKWDMAVLEEGMAANGLGPLAVDLLDRHASIPQLRAHSIADLLEGLAHVSTRCDRSVHRADANLEVAPMTGRCACCTPWTTTHPWNTS